MPSNEDDKKSVLTAVNQPAKIEPNKTSLPNVAPAANKPVVNNNNNNNNNNQAPKQQQQPAQAQNNNNKPGGGPNQPNQNKPQQQQQQNANKPADNKQQTPATNGQQSANKNANNNNNKNQPNNQKGNVPNGNQANNNNNNNNNNNKSGNQNQGNKNPNQSNKPGQNQNQNKNRYQNQNGHGQNGQYSDSRSNQQSQQQQQQQGEKKFTGRCRLFVGNLPSDINETEFKELFTKFGEVGECFLNTQRSFGFIKLDTRLNAEHAKQELDGYTLRGRCIRVRFASHGAAVRVKNISPFVSNEYLEQAFSIFGPVERAVVIVDEKGRATGEGIVEFERKPAASQCINRCTDNCFILTSYPKPVIVEPLEQKDDEDGLPEKSIIKNAQFHMEREVSPHFAPNNSIELELALKWRELYEQEKLIMEESKKRVEQARELLEYEIEQRLIDHKTQKIKEDLRAKQEELERIEGMRKNEFQRRQDMEMRRHEEERRRIEEMTGMYGGGGGGGGGRKNPKDGNGIMGGGRGPGGPMGLNPGLGMPPGPGFDQPLLNQMVY